VHGVLSAIGNARAVLSRPVHAAVEPPEIMLGAIHSEYSALDQLALGRWVSAASGALTPSRSAAGGQIGVVPHEAVAALGADTEGNVTLFALG
jgi:hypothetical protein